MTRRTFLSSVACYLAVALLLLAFAVLRVRTQNRFAAQGAPDVLPEYSSQLTTPPDKHAKPFFSIQTNRTYATSDRTRLWINYRGVESLDFRVYRVKDPVKFFRQLDNPHQVGEDEQMQVGQGIKRKPTFLEKLRAFKSYVYGGIKGYTRAQLQNQSRKRFNQKFRAGEEDDESNRTPLNVADYARVPLLNPDQMVSSWREKLPALENVYDRRMISLGKREAGVYLVEVVNGDLRAFGVAVVTDIALVQKTSSNGQMHVFAVDRKTGAPREGTRVQVIKGKRDVMEGLTDANGVLKLQMTQDAPPKSDAEEEDAGDEDETGDEADEASTDNSYLVMATAGANFAVSDLDSYYFGGGGEDGEGGSPNLTSYIYTDRPVYRPQQKVYFKGILRRLTEQGYKLLPDSQVSVTIEDTGGGRIYEQDLALSSRGTFSGELDLPEDAALGSYNINARVGDDSATGYFNVEEYKKPEFKVQATTPQQFVNVGEKTKFTVSARYFFGAPVTRADVKYFIHRKPAYNRWDSADGEDSEDEIGADPSAEEAGSGEFNDGYGDSMVKEGDGKLDAQGRLDIEFTVPELGEKSNSDYIYSIEAQVTDASRRTMEGSTSFTGVRGNIVAYAGAERYVYYEGDTAKILVTTNDREGRPLSSSVKLTFFERRWEKVTKRTEAGDEYPEYELRERELSSAVVATDAQGKASFDYAVPLSGNVHIKTTVEENGRRIVSDAGSIWVADRANRWTDLSYEEEGQIKLVPDKKSYSAGETAHVLALLPTDNAHLLVTTELTSVMSVRNIHSTGRALIIDVPIETRHAPNVFLNVTYVRNSDMYSQDVMLVVPARDRLLNLQIVPNKKEYRPRETASYTVLARDASGAPVSNAEVSLGVVDESIYQITPESVGDIRREFYGRRYNQVQTNFSVNFYFTGYAGKKIVNLAASRKAYNLADFKNEGETVNPAVRKLFKDTAFWQPSVLTGADGKATVKFELPDNLTTWRATARAVTADTRVGTAVEKVVERKDVIIRMAMPRFLTQGDTVTLSGIVHNYLKEDKATRITIDVAGARLLDVPQQSVTVAKGGDFRINWRVAAPDVGELRVLAKALTDTESDAVELSIPIVPRGLRQTRAESIVLADEEVEKSFTYSFPANADAGARSLRVEVAPSIAGTLFGALDYLTGFPYGCTEQTMSQFLPTLIVKGALQNVEAASIKDSNDIDRKVRRGLKRLYNYQHDDGGWGWWKTDPTDAFMTAYVVDGLAIARGAGYEVDETRLERAREKLKALIDAGRTEDGEQLDAERRAYMIYALNESGGADARYLNELFNNRGRLQAYGRALLALALKTRGDERRAGVVAGEIERAAKVTPADAHWPSRRQGLHGAIEESIDVEATALSLKALARIAPQSEISPKAARWLVARRRHGHYWNSTKDTAFAVYGLTDYLKTSRELQPDYALEVYVNGEQVLARQVTAADAASGQTFVVERKGGAIAGPTEVRVVKRGRGVLYFSTTLTHHTNEETVAAQGSPQLRLSREYQRLRVVDSGDGALAWKVEPLTGELHSGDIIVSRLRLEGERANYLLIEDPIPAGCEQIEQVSGINLDYNEKDWSDWYSAREFRDRRAAFFLHSFDGSATYQYAMRVQVPGQFRVAPARVELMYQPEVQANSAGAALTILDRR